MGVFSKVVENLMAVGTRKSAISIMTNHIIYTSLDEKNPVSASPKAIDFIRNALPCDGIDLIVDCVHMASFAKEKTFFLERLSQASSLHTGGTIVTTHFVKKFTREAIVDYCEAMCV
jgi:beta-glucosidase-like glycosyl hydrolase